MSEKIRMILAASAAVVWAAACGERPEPATAGRLQLAVAPLSLPGVVDACYGLDVLNEAGETVWTKTGLCAATFGDQVSSIAYVGSCDASDPNADGVSEAVVVLHIEGLYAVDGGGGVTPLNDWKNPCAPPYAAVTGVGSRPRVSPTLTPRSRSTSRSCGRRTRASSTSRSTSKTYFVPLR